MNDTYYNEKLDRYVELIKLNGYGFGAYVEYCNVGGGFLQKMAYEAFKELYVKKDLPTELVPSTFTCVAEELQYKGIHRPHDLWNGWAKPFFTREVISKIIEDMDDGISGSNSGYIFLKDGKLACIYANDDNDVIKVMQKDSKWAVTDENGKPFYDWTVEVVTPIDVGDKKYYAFDNGWCWDSWTNEELEKLNNVNNVNNEGDN